MHKNDYSCIVYFKSSNPKKWVYVHTLDSFAKFLDIKHRGWTYFNVYERRTGLFLKRFYLDNAFPKFITACLLALIFSVLPPCKKPLPLNSTLELTFNNFFSISATIPTQDLQKRGRYVEA